MVVVLYNVRSVYNVASIFRTADAAGAEKICLCGITPGPIDRFGRERKQFTRVSLGAEQSVQWEKADDILALMDALQKRGYRILAIEQSSRSIPYYKYNDVRRHYMKTAVILGNEVSGLPEQVLKKSDKILEIPMKGKKESLNVSVAFGVIAFHLLHNR